jgi:hypothetical protein
MGAVVGAPRPAPSRLLQMTFAESGAANGSLSGGAAGDSLKQQTGSWFVFLIDYTGNERQGGRSPGTFRSQKP